MSEASSWLFLGSQNGWYRVHYTLGYMPPKATQRSGQRDGLGDLSHPTPSRSLTAYWEGSPFFLPRMTNAIMAPAAANTAMPPSTHATTLLLSPV